MADTEKPKVVTLDILRYYHNEIKELFVQTETGKGLSSNDFTAELKEKLENITIPDGYDVATEADIDELLNDAYGSETETQEAGTGGGTDSGD